MPTTIIPVLILKLTSYFSRILTLHLKTTHIVHYIKFLFFQNTHSLNCQLQANDKDSRQRLSRFNLNENKYKNNNTELMAADFVDEDFIRADENDYDIIIVGAGLAGLTCAYHILRKQIGLDVLIIEENSEVGGRILSNFSETYQANSLQKHVTDLVNTLQLKIDQQRTNDTKKRILYTKGKSLQSLPKFYGAEVHYFLRTIERIALNPKFNNYTEHEEAKLLAETSVEQLLRKIVHFPYARLLCRAFICSTCALRNLNDISALWFFVMLNGASGFLNRLRITIGDGNRYFLQGGMAKIARELLKNILRQEGEIRYVERVNEISFNDHRAYVSTEKKYFRCEFVVVAIPPSMQNRITIEPSQCPNTETLYAPAENVFFNVVYKKAFSSENCINDILTTWDSNSNLNTVYDASRGNTERVVLAGFLAEPNLIHTQKTGLFDTLSDCYKTAEASKYSRYKEYDQSLINDQIKAGCPMSAMRPSSFDNLVRCSRNSYDRIFFASSEYANNWPGTIDGAIQAGENTAYAILLQIRPQALTFYELSRFSNATVNAKTRREPYSSFKMSVLQYLGIILNIAVFLSFLKVAYD